MGTLSMRTLVVGPLQMNAYLLYDRQAGEAMLVDPGAEADVLSAAVIETGCRLARLACTHGHFDHVGAAAKIQTACGLPLLCHPDESELIRRMPDSQAAWGFPRTEVPVLEPSLTDGSKLSVGGTELTVRHVPGHSPGHVAFFWGNEGLVGDLIFARSVGRTDLPGSDADALVASIRRHIYTLPGRTRLYPGHGPATDVASERRENPFVRP